MLIDTARATGVTLAMLLIGCHPPATARATTDGGTDAAMGSGSGGAPDLAMTDPLCSAAAPADIATSKQRSQRCGVGAEAPLLLKPQPYTSIVIEIATTAGATPRQAAIDHLEQMIQDLTGKSATVVMDPVLPA